MRSALLDAKLLENGLTDWRPDGIVLSKGVNDPSDKLSDEYLEARDGQLFNIRIQGPAVGTAWTGERSMEVLPLDKVFVVLVADVWFDADALTDEDASVEPGRRRQGRPREHGHDQVASWAKGQSRPRTTCATTRCCAPSTCKEALDEEAFKAKQVRPSRAPRRARCSPTSASWCRRRRR